MEYTADSGSPGFERKKTGSGLIEFLILLAGMFLLSAWNPSDSLPWDRVIFPAYDGNAAWHYLVASFAAGIVFAVFAIPVLLLVRYVPSRIGVILGAFLWTLFISLSIYAEKSLPVIREIRRTDELHLFRHAVLIDSSVIVLRFWLWALVAVLSGYYAVRTRFSYFRLVGGTVIGGYLAGWLIAPFINLERWWLAPWCYAAFNCLLVSLPGYRGSLERLLGFRCGPGVSTPPLPASPQAVLASHLTLLLVGVLVALSAVVNYYEAQQFRFFREGSPAPWRSAADTNAYDVMKEYFQKNGEGPQITAIKKSAEIDKAFNLRDQMSSASQEKILAEINMPELKAYLAEISNFTDTFVKASRTDYLQYPGAKLPGFLNLRESAYALALESQIALRDNRTTEAVESVTSLIRMGALMSDQPLLVTQMIGVAIRNIGIRTVSNLVAAAPNNKVLLNNLEASLANTSSAARVCLDYRALKDGEFGTFNAPIIPNVSTVVPAFMRAHKDALVSWMNFDLVRMAVALQRYKLDKGMYPETLVMLVPDYLDAIPREPLEGKDYSYSRTADGWYRLSNPAYKRSDRKYNQALFMPPMLAPDPELEEKVAGK